MKKILSIFMALVMMAVFVAVQAEKVFAVMPRSVPDGIYIIASLLEPRKVLDIQGGGTERGRNVIIWEEHGGANQAFNFSYDESDGYYTIKSMHSGKYIGVEKLSDEQTTQIKQYDSPVGDNLKWAIILNSAGYYQLELKTNNLRLDVCGGSKESGTILHLWQRNDSNAQKFYLYPAYFATGDPQGRYFADDIIMGGILYEGQIKDIDIDTNGEKVIFKANIPGIQKWFEYKFVWKYKDNGKWNEGRWGVIRDFSTSDTVEWVPPNKHEDYVIYMDVRDRYGHCFTYVKEYLLDIDMKIEGDGVRLKANPIGNNNWVEYKFVWKCHDCGKWNEGRWGVIRDFSTSDTVEWVPPSKREDYVIYMDVRDAHGKCIPGFNKHLPRKLLQAQVEAESLEKKEKELIAKVQHEQEKAEEEKARQKQESEALERNKKRAEELKEAKDKLKDEILQEEQDLAKKAEIDISSEIEQLQKAYEEFEKKKKELEAKLAKARQEAIQKKEKSQNKQELQTKIAESEKLTDEEKSKTEDLEATRNRLEEQLGELKQREQQIQDVEEKEKTDSEAEDVKPETKEMLDETDSKDIDIEETDEIPDTQPVLRVEELKKLYPEFSEYISCIEKIVENEIAEQSAVGSDILSAQDTSLKTISDKLSYVCNKISQDKSVKNVELYPVQILAVMKLVESVLTPEPGMRGSIGDIKTGEGKSLVVTLAAIILQSYNRKIDIVTPNMELATRDWKDSKPYYDLFEISSGYLYDKIKDAEFKDESNESSEEDIETEYNNEVLKKSIVYTTSGNLQWMYLKGSLSGKALRDREYDICIIDEVDNILIDGTSSPALLAGNYPTKDGEEILKTVSQGVQEGKSKSEIKDELERKFKGATIEPELDLMINAAKRAQELERGKDYILEEDKLRKNKVIIINQNTGFKMNTSRWSEYVHEMVEIKEGVILHPTSVTKCAVAPIIFFGAYRNCLGVTGTAGGEIEADIFKNLYKLTTFKVPTHRGTNRKVVIKIYDPEEENVYELISKEALDSQKKGRPVLIIMESINATNEIREKFLKDANLIQGIDVKADRESIKKAGRSGTVTISTIAAGRGTDIKLDAKAIKAGGLHVIVSKLPPQGRTLLQNIGRASRQGQPGSATIYVRPGDEFADIEPISTNAVNLFRLQKRFAEYVATKWPWMLDKRDIYTSLSEYKFGANVEDILETDAVIILDRFFWPKKVLTVDECQEHLDLTKNMVLTAWGRMYTRLAVSEKSSDIDYCNTEYEEFLKSLHKWIPEGCKNPGDCLKDWAKRKLYRDERGAKTLSKAEVIFNLLYTRPPKGTTIRQFVKGLFEYKIVQYHAQKAGHNLKKESLDSLVKFLPEEHQKAYAALLKAEEEYEQEKAEYNRKLVEYNKRENERNLIVQENNQVYTRTVSKTVEIPSKPEVRRPVEGPQQIALPESAPEEKKGLLQKTVGKFFNSIFLEAHAAGVSQETLGKDETIKFIVPDIAEPLTNYEFEVIGSDDKVTSFSPETSLKRIIVSTENYKGRQRELPPSWPRPKFPADRDWSSIGWDEFEGLNVDKAIWDRWDPPMKARYLSLKYLGCDVDAAKLGSMTDEELDRLDDEIKKMSYWLQNKQKAYLREMKRREFTRYTRLCELLPEPIKNYRKAVLGFLSDIDAKASASFEPPVKPGGLLGAVMGFEVGLTKDLPKDLIVGTLKTLLDPVGSVLGFLESIDYNNSNNFVNQTVNAWQSGDSYSRGRMVGNATGQVALMVTPVIIKKFPKVSAGLSEARAIEAGSELATIGEEASAAARGAKAAGAELAEVPMTRVGRWMSRAEYEKMVQTGRVQKPYRANQSYIANPADINAFYKQAEIGSVYVEFDVPSSSIRQTKDVWAMIPGPDSIYSKLNQRKGLPPIEDFPKVTNIKLIGEK